MNVRLPTIKLLKGFRYILSQKVLPLRKMSIVKSAFFAVIKVFWKGVWGKASFSKEVSPKRFDDVVYVQVQAFCPE